MSGLGFFHRLFFVSAVCASVLASGSFSFAQSCNVPGTHGSIQEAVDDLACAMIVLSAGTYVESVGIYRSLTVSGPATGGSVVQGLILVEGPETTVQFADLTVFNGCSPDALRTTGGAMVSASGLTVERSAGVACPDIISVVFYDGFESGAMGAWSVSLP